jgi:hypothetical protein
MSHLKEVRGYKVEKSGKGIYTVIGDIVPIQIIDSKELSVSENLWLKDLNDGLDKTLARQLWFEIDRQGKAAQTGAYLEAIFNANVSIMREVSKLSDVALTMDKVLEEAGLTAIWEARGEEKGKIEVAKNAINQGLPEDTIVAITGLDLETIRKIAGQL